MSRKTPSGQPGKRRNRLLREREHDPYKVRAKLPDPTTCTSCSLIYRDGRWTRGSPPVDAHRTLCPACQRARNDDPAGTLSLGGAFLTEHRDEILSLARHVETRDQDTHPLKRILRIEDTEEGVAITATDPDLVHSIGKAIRSAYGGELQVRYGDGEKTLRAWWER